jgi:hypothetical protein
VEEPDLLIRKKDDLRRIDEEETPSVDGVDAVWSYFARTSGF